MARFLQKTMPPDPAAQFVWPALAADIARRGHFRYRTIFIIAVAMLSTTIGALYLLLQLPFLDLSVVEVATRALELLLPRGWAITAAWVLGVVGVVALGPFSSSSPAQRTLQKRRATKFEGYNFILELALLEEQLFRSGSEKWTWIQRIRASALFGLVHITNIWYSLAAGIAIGLAGFGLTLVYLWYYRKTKDQVVATAASATLHAVYNVTVIALIVCVLAFELANIIM